MIVAPPGKTSPTERSVARSDTEQGRVLHDHRAIVGVASSRDINLLQSDDIDAPLLALPPALFVLVRRVDRVESAVRIA
jgi:hypothetical protein